MRSRMHFPSTLLMVGMVAISSLLLPTMLKQQVFAATTDKFGIAELYPTAGGGPVWFLNNTDPEDDKNFDFTSAKDIDMQREDPKTYEMDAETGSHQHGVRIHANAPDDKEWKNVEMTGYFKLDKGSDQFTLIARQGPTYNDDGGCGAYGYYGLIDSNGDAYFKKKLFHNGGGYTDRTAEKDHVVDNLEGRWIGIKLVAYNLNDNDVKLELWVDNGDQTNHWTKATEYVDDGNWETHDSDCNRSSDDRIEEGPRGGYRIDDSEFDFKDLSIREINSTQLAGQL